MPNRSSCEPRVMFPPPMTTATCTPSSIDTMISSAARPTASMSIPCPPLLQSASPESLSRTRLNGPSPLPRDGAWLGSDADLEPLKAHDLDGGSQSLRRLLHE